MSTPVISDDLWAVVEPLLPPEPPKPKGGRPRLPNRAVLTSIVFVLTCGFPWDMPPQELGCGSGLTCGRRLRAWRHAGVCDPLHQTLLQRLSAAGRLDWSRASLDSASVPAPGGAKRANPPRRIAANRARRAICWSNEGVCRWPCS